MYSSMLYQELANRLADIHSPMLRGSGEPTALEEGNLARAVVAYLASQPVLYSLAEIETPSECIGSIIRTRQFLADQQIKLEPTSNLAGNLCAMHAACQKFLARAFDRKEIERYGTKRTYWASWILISSLGELRGVIGVHLAVVAAQYKLDIEGPLEDILPLAGNGYVPLET